jgi:hypothetical protein
MTVSWHGALFDSSPLETPFPTRFGLSLTAAQVLDAGVGPAIPVTWGVIDVAGNWSGWAKETVVDVRIEDPGLIEAPHVGDKDQAWTEIDLATLGTADLTVFTPEYAGAVRGDSVSVHVHGTSVGGDTVTFDSLPQTMTGDGFGLTFTVPNATVQPLAASNLRVWYSVSGKGDSKSVWLPVRGVAQGDLPVPAVTEAVDTNGDGLADQLDPDQANPSGRVVIDYPGMARFDTVTLVLDGTAASGAPVQVTFERQISDVAPLTVVVIHADLLKFLDGQMDVYYRVEPFGKRKHPALTRALLPPESAHLALRVRRGSAEQPLPAPTVDELVGGILDPAAEQATLRAPLYPGIAKGNEITYTWVGAVSTREWTYKVTDPATTPADYADHKFITTNTGGEVVVSYIVKRGGAEPPLTSDTLRFAIGTPLYFGVDRTLMTKEYYVAEGRPPQIPPVEATYVQAATGGLPPYTYSSADPLVATIDTDGKVRACGNGSATIVVTDRTGNVAVHKVTVTGARVFRNVTESAQLDDEKKADWFGVRKICAEGGWAFPELIEIKKFLTQYEAERPVASSLGWKIETQDIARYWSADSYGANQAWMINLNGDHLGDGNHYGLNLRTYVIVMLTPR